MSERDDPPPEYLSGIEVRGLWAALESNVERRTGLYLAARKLWPVVEGDATRQARKHPLIQEAFLRSIEPVAEDSEELRRPLERTKSGAFLNIAFWWMKSIASEWRDDEARSRGDAQPIKKLKTKLTRARSKRRGEGLPADGPETASVLVELGLAYQHLEEFGKAVEALSEALHIQKEALRVGNNKLDPVEVVASYQRLAVALRGKGDHARAVEEYRAAIELGERIFAPHGVGLVLALKGLARVHVSMGAYDLAEAALRRALAIEEEALKRKDRSVEAADVIATCRLLGNALAMQGKTADARAIDERREAIRGMPAKRGKRQLSAERRKLSRLLASLAGVQPEEVIDGVMVLGAASPEQSAMVNDAITKLRTEFAENPDLLAYLEDRIRKEFFGEDKATEPADELSAEEQEAVRLKTDATRVGYRRNRNRIFPEG